MAAKRPPVPGGLQLAGQQLWKDIAWKYPLRPDELKILRDACLAEDIQASLAADIAISPLKTQGSQGQDVINPSYTEWRQYSAVAATHLARLKLPDDPSSGQPNKQQAALSAARRAAVRSRHDRGGVSTRP